MKIKTMHQMIDHITIAEKMRASGKNKLEIINALESQGATDKEARIFTNQVHKSFYLKKRKRGFVLGIMGTALLFTGFFLSLFLFHADKSIDITLYGMSSTGAFLLLSGMVDLLDW